MSDFDKPKAQDLRYIGGQKLVIHLNWVCVKCGYDGGVSKIVSNGDSIDCKCSQCGAMPINTTVIGGGGRY